MRSHQTRVASATGFLLTVAVASVLLTLPGSVSGAEAAGGARVSFNRGQDAANIADALDNRVEEEAAEAAGPGDEQGEQPEEPDKPLMAQDVKPDGDDRPNPQAPSPALQPVGRRASDDDFSVSIDSDSGTDMQLRLRHDSHASAHRDAYGGGHRTKPQFHVHAARQPPPPPREQGEQGLQPAKDELGRSSEDFPPAAKPRISPPDEMLRLFRDAAAEEKGPNPGPMKYRDAMEGHVRALEQYVMKMASRDPNEMSADEVQEQRSICEDVQFELREQRQAFEQVLKEKNLLGKTVKDEEAALFALQEKVQHPEFKQWLKNRAARFSEHFENSETDAVAYYARRFVEPQVFKARNRISALEGRLEKTVDVVLPAKYGSFVALILALIVVVVPIFVTLSAITSITKAISMRQHVLICNLCISSFVIALAVCGLVLQADPLKTLYNASESGFIFLQFCLVVLFMTSLFMLGRALYNARDDRDMIVFGSQLIFYVLVGVSHFAIAFTVSSCSVYLM